MKQKHWWNIFHVIVNANFIIEHVSQIKNGIMCANVSVKMIVLAKEVKVGIPAHAFVRIVGI